MPYRIYRYTDSLDGRPSEFDIVPIERVVAHPYGNIGRIIAAFTVDQLPIIEFAGRCVGDEAPGYTDHGLALPVVKGQTVHPASRAARREARQAASFVTAAPDDFLQAFSRLSTRQHL